jgi:hypothetical protein
MYVGICANCASHQVTSENGTLGTPVTLQFIVALSPLYGWNAVVNTNSFGNPVILNNTSPAYAGVFLLPYTAAGDAADIEISIPVGAVIVPPLTSIIIQLGGRGSSFNYSFSVRPETGDKGVMSNYTIQFFIPLSTDNSWEALVDTPDGQESDLFKGAPPDAGVNALDSSYIGDVATILFTLPDGATLWPPSLNAQLNPTFTLIAGTVSYVFQVRAENGDLSDPYTISFLVRDEAHACEE